MCGMKTKSEYDVVGMTRWLECGAVAVATESGMRNEQPLSAASLLQCHVGANKRKLQYFVCTDSSGLVGPGNHQNRKAFEDPWLDAKLNATSASSADYLEPRPTWDSPSSGSS